MKTRHLALRVTLNSTLMLTGVYLVMQVVTYLRDNIIMGVSDLSGMAGYTASFMVSAVVPPVLIFGVVLFLAALPFQRTLARLEAGETLPEAEAEKVRRGMLGFSRLVLGLNLAGFVLGYVLNILGDGNPLAMVAPDNLVILGSNIAGGFLYAGAQSSLNNIAFAPLRDRLGLHAIGDRPREMSSTRRQVLATMVMALYVLSHMELNHQELMLVESRAATVQAQVTDGTLQEAESGDAFRKALAMGGTVATRRAGFSLDSVVPPWVMNDSLADRSRMIFFLSLLFNLGVVIMVQACMSLDRKEQMDALMSRLADVVKGEGNLKARVTIRGTDDMGELTELINGILDQFGDMVGGIGVAARGTTESAHAIARVLDDNKGSMARTMEAITSLSGDLGGLARDSGKLHGILESFTRAARGVEESVEAQRNSVSGASSAMEEMAASIDSVASMTSRSGELAVSLAARGREGQEKASESTRAMAEIKEASRGVLEVLAVLNRISASINLLAMNAAIEAAHAGDRGAGFAVVADEVRSLALDSASQTRRIKELMQTMTVRVDRGVATTAASHDVLGRLVTGLQEAESISTGISQAMQEQSAGTRSAASTLEDIVAATAKIHGRIEDQDREVRAMEEALTRTVRELGDLAAASGDHARAIEGLGQAFGQVQDQVGRNLEVVAVLDDRTRRFR